MGRRVALWTQRKPESHAAYPSRPKGVVRQMPRFLDIHHHAQGMTRDQVAAAHAKDLAVQGKHGVTFVRYWYDETTGKIFCLSDAPTREAVTAVHREAHGALADEMFEVIEGD
jgi:hypothetical protein